MRSFASKVGFAALFAAMLGGPAVGATPHSEFIGYQAFTKAGGKVELYDDKGLVVEMVVNCGGGRFGIVTLSKVEQVFCGPDHRCVGNLDSAISRLCR